jgi:hypothetical protein
MKTLCAFFFGLCVASVLAADPPARPAPQGVSKDAARQAIAIFRQEPVSDRGREAAATIFRFAQGSPDVEVVKSKNALPWLATRALTKYNSVLLTAYIAGSVLSQLDSGLTRNDPVAGAVQVIETYQLIQKTDPTFRMPEVEKLVDLQTQGKLKEYVETP